LGSASRKEYTYYVQLNFLEAVVKPTKMNLEEEEDMQSTEGSRRGLNKADRASYVLPKGSWSGFCKKESSEKDSIER
jgi:hypothetical protein